MSSSPSLSIYEQNVRTQDQVNAIQEEIRESQPPASSLQPIASLPSHLKLIVDEHVVTNSDQNVNNVQTTKSLANKANQNFIDGCNYLSTKYKTFRAIRGDGNCYYRAFLYSTCERLIRNDNSHPELKRIQFFVKESIHDVVKHGYDKFTIDMFHEEIVYLFDFLVAANHDHNNDYDTKLQKLHDKLNQENGTSDYCIWYLRVLTSTYLKKNGDRFIHYIMGEGDGFTSSYVDVPTFCAREVDPMGKECTMVSVLALAEAFGIVVHVEYLDGNPLINDDGGQKKLMKHSFGILDGNDGNNVKNAARSNDPLSITLLYRPGHYDILY